MRQYRKSGKIIKPHTSGITILDDKELLPVHLFFDQQKSTMSQTAAENITLGTENIDFNPHNFSRKNVTSKFQQKSKLRSLQRLFRVFDHNILVVQERSHQDEKKFMLNLSLLDEQPKKFFQVNMRYLYLTLFLVINVLLLHVQRNLGFDIIAEAHFISVIALLDTLVAMSIIWLISVSKYYWVFRTEFGNTAVIQLLVNNPNKKSYRQFMAELQQSIETAKQQRNIPTNLLLPAVLSEHRRLRDEGIISDGDYEMAKVNILGYHPH